MLNRSSMKFCQYVSQGILLKKQLGVLSNNTQPIRSSHYAARNILFKEELKDLTLIGQFDKKFLLLIRNSDCSLIIFDQHAVHERVLYEYYSLLLKQAVYGDEVEKRANNVRLNLFEDIYEKYDLPRAVELDPQHYSVNIEAFSQLYSMEEVQSILFFDFVLQRKGGIKLLSVPIVFDKVHKLEKLIKVFLIVISNIKVYLEELKEKNNISKAKKIMKLFDPWIRSKACRNAIKFNDALDRDYMALLISNLGECLNPFLCAHGRHSFYFIKQKKT